MPMAGVSADCAGEFSAAGQAVREPANLKSKWALLLMRRRRTFNRFNSGAKSRAFMATTDIALRAGVLEKAADLYETHAYEFFALLAREAAKTINDWHWRVREPWIF